AAIAADASEVAVFASASEGFSQRNINCSISESLQRFQPVMRLAAEHGIAVRGYVSCVLGCPYDGPVAPHPVAAVSAELLAMGCYETSLGDTVGAGVASATRQLIETVAERVPREQLAGHFHDTYGQALSNIYAALLEGVSVFDSSVAGLGGCPYATGASGNVASEDVLYMLDGMGIDTGVDIEQLVRTGQWICQVLGRDNGWRVGRAMEAYARDVERDQECRARPGRVPSRHSELAANPMAGMEPGPPRRDRECRVPPRHSELAATPPWPAWNPALPRATGCGEFHLDTAGLPQPPWPGCNPALPGATGNVEFHLDTASLQQPLHGGNGTRPSQARPGVSSSTSTQRACRKPHGRDGTRPSQARPGVSSSTSTQRACRKPHGRDGTRPSQARPGVSSSTSTQRAGSNLHGRDGTRPSQARPECRVPPRHSVLAANPMAGMEPGPPRRDLNVEFHLDTQIGRAHV